MAVKEFDVTGIGNAIVDLQVEVNFDEFAKFGVEAGSMNLVDGAAFENLCKNLSNKDLKTSSGGSGANTCVALADLGNKVSYSCIVGDDDYGKGYEKELTALNISLSNPRIADGVTGRSLLMITPDAERTMNTFLGITSAFGPEHVDQGKIANSKWLYVEGYLFSTESGRKAVHKAVKVAKENDVKIAVTCSDGFIVDLFKNDLLDICKESDLIFANRNEATRLTEETSEDAALLKLKELANTCVITLSDKGAIAYSNGESIREDSFLVKAVDDTGAGDSFAAGFMDAFLKGKSLKHSVLTGSYLASRVVSQFGARLSGSLIDIINSSQELQKRLN